MRPVSLKIDQVNMGKQVSSERRTDIIAQILTIQLARYDVARIPNIQSLADSLNLSPSRLRHVVKQKMGVSFNRLVKTLRLQQARQLLQETSWSVKQVMLEVGMSDHSHFSKDYKKEFRESPSYTRALAARKVSMSDWPPNSHCGHK